MDVEKLFKTLHENKWSWCSHAVIGAAIYLAFGLYGVLAAFIYRELSDFITALVTRSKPWHAAALDGFMDLWSPLAAVAALMAFGL
jgi:hypothetical protein